MSAAKADFGGSVPETYERYLVPLFFQDYAEHLASGVEVAEGAVLEVAAGTGAVTRVLRSRLPASVALTATDLNEAMLAVARAKLGHLDGLDLRPADATDLPFADASFDAVVCQFGVMFFPDKKQGYAEAARVLKPGGSFHFNVWDSLPRNAFAHLVHQRVAELCADDPPAFLALPFGYHDIDGIARELQEAGFGEIKIAVLPRQSRAETAADVARAIAGGSPLLAELEAREMAGEETLAAIERAVAERYGRGPVAAPMQAISFVARLP